MASAGERNVWGVIRLSDIPSDLVEELEIEQVFYKKGRGPDEKGKLGNRSAFAELWGLETFRAKPSDEVEMRVLNPVLNGETVLIGYDRPMADRLHRPVLDTLARHAKAELANKRVAELFPDRPRQAQILVAVRKRERVGRFKISEVIWAGAREESF
jgi:hypothetical protein